MLRKSLTVAVAVAISLGTLSLTRSSDSEDADDLVAVAAEDLRTAVFAGGCFWCMEPPFEKLSGVISVESGYTGGFKKDPTYEEVSHTETGHVEAVRVTYDASRLSYEDLLQVFWRNIDPTDDGGQFVDRGTSYLSAIFVENETERAAAQQSKQRLEDSGRFDIPIVTPIRDASKFYMAEEYHQDYYKKNPLKYKYYRYRSGRDQSIDKVWGADREYVPPRAEKRPTDAEKSVTRDDASGRRVYRRPSDREIRTRLTKLQFDVTQNDATERAFRNDFWDHSEDGIYVDIVSGEPLFSSRDKFKSGTGWPSFTKPLVPDHVVEVKDYKLIWPRTEVRSKHADSHLGHLFSDGPAETGLRYCINSAALRFVPANELEQNGYGQYRSLFEPVNRS